MKTREDFLSKAEELINGPRAKEYGPAKMNHERIAAIWNVFLERKLVHAITPEGRLLGGYYWLCCAWWGDSK
jgi:hypothetical protein